MLYSALGFFCFFLRYTTTLGTRVCCILWRGAVVHPHSDHSVFALLRLPIVAIMGLCLIAGAASITFIESTLSLYLVSQVTRYKPAPTCARS